MTAVVRVAGRCPMGCGPTLFLGVEGHVTCSRQGCPDPAASDELLEHAPGLRCAAQALVEHLDDAWWVKAANHLGVLRAWIRSPGFDHPHGEVAA